MGNDERRKEEGPSEEQTTFYDGEWALHAVALPSLGRHVYSTTSWLNQKHLIK